MIRKISCRTPFFLLAVLAGLILSQCNDNTLAPFEPEITSAPDNFQLQATGVKDRTATLIYSWTNSGTQATIDHSTTTDAGSAHVIIKDVSGKIVYDHELVPSLTDSTITGAPGGWEIHLMLKHYSGTLNFRVQKL